MHRNGGSLRNCLLAATYTASLFILSTLPGTAQAQPWQELFTVSPTIQNLGHLPAYGLLAMLWFFTLKPFLPPRNRALVAAGLFAFLYGVLLELAQIAVPGRYPSLSDCVLNLTGIVVFASGYLVTAFVTQPRDRPESHLIAT